LIELSRTPVIVVSAGVKSILDIKRTLEVLETFGVPTGAWMSEEFPAFFSPVSGVKAPAVFNDAMDVAYAWMAGRDLGMSNGMLVAVPNHDPAGTFVEEAIQEALKEASDKGIEGRRVTPFILKNVAQKTGGDSLRRSVNSIFLHAACLSNLTIDVSCTRQATSRWLRTML
jgi:pseudouridine-5'-phosphate glycosidase